MSMAASRGNFLLPDKNAILAQTFTEALQNNFNSVQKWTNWKEDHEKLKKHLENLPNKLSHPAVVPFGSRALVRANIVRTNEVLSCIGDGYFIKQSAKQAIDMCDRRIKDSTKMLEDLEKERNLIKSRQTLPRVEEAFPSEDQEEIVEEYDEEKEAEWRVRHREMEKKYRKELAELRKKCVEEGPPQTEEELFRRLDMLELEEELNDELERLNIEEDSDELEESSEENDNNEESEKQDCQEKDTETEVLEKSPQTSNTFNSGLTQTDKPVLMDNAGSFEGYEKTSKNSPSLEPGEVYYGFTDEEGNQWQKQVLANSENEESLLQKSRKSVSFASDDEESEVRKQEDTDSDIYIRFKHSSYEFHEPPENQTTESGTLIHINSPRDIYKQFLSCSKPKSILKKTYSHENESSACEGVPPSLQPFGTSFGLTWKDEDETIENTPQPAIDVSNLPPILLDVMETDPSEQTAPQPRPAGSSRPVSKFKAARAAARK